MALGTKGRQNQTADVCKQHLRDNHREKLSLVEEFIVEIEGAGKNRDLTKWSRFRDSKDIEKEMLARLDGHFQEWLDPSA